MPRAKKHLCDGEFWSDGYFSSTAGKHCDELMLLNYVKNLSNNYEQLHSDHQLAMFKQNAPLTK